METTTTVLVKRWWFSYFVWFIFTSCAIIIAADWLKQQSKHYQVSVIELNGEISAPVLQAALNSLQNFLNVEFFELKMAALKQTLEAIPGIANAKVTKIWPNKLAVNLIEQQAFARLAGGGYITAIGEFFKFAPDASSNAFGNEQLAAQIVTTGVTIKQQDETLPLFSGAAAKYSTMLETYLTLTAKLHACQLTINTLEIMPDRTWQAMLNNGIVLVLGKTELLTRANRFVLAYNRVLHARSNNIAYVDTRYTNGVAVGWR